MAAPIAHRDLQAAPLDPAIAVSIVIPARDAAATLPTALGCLADQGFDPRALQPIVVDDGSVDGTAAAAGASSSTFPQLTVRRHEAPLGPAAARNTGLASARGRHIAFLDADDWLAPGHLAQLAGGLAAMDVSFVKCDHTIVLGRRREVRRAPETRRGVALSPRDGILPADATTMVDYPNLPTGLYRRDLLDAGLLWLPEAIPSAEDRAWTWRLHLNAPSFGVVDAAGMFYRRGNPRSLSASFDDRRLGYLDAARWVAGLLDEDRDGGEFYPKLVAQTLILTGFHLARRRRLPTSLRRRIIAGCAAVLADFPAEPVAATLATAPRYLRHRLRPVLRKLGS